MGERIIIALGITISLGIIGALIYQYIMSPIKDSSPVTPTKTVVSDQEKKTEQSPDQKKLLEEMKNQPNSPYYHQIYSATSQDGLTWTKLGKMLFDHASVPGAAIKEGTIYLYFVDASEGHGLSVGISGDNGKTFNKKSVIIEGQEEGNAVDPHPELVGNKIRLYYLGGFLTLPTSKEKFKMYSAESTDGINFTNQQFAYEDDTITDPDVFATDTGWRMLVSKGRGLDLLISKDEGITFTKDQNFSWNGGGVCDTFNFNGTYRTFYCGEGISTATGANLGKLTKESAQVIDESGKVVCDPSVIRLPDGSYLMFYKTQDVNQLQSPDQNPGQAKLESSRD